MNYLEGAANKNIAQKLTKGLFENEPQIIYREVVETAQITKVPSPLRKSPWRGKEE